MVFQKQICFCKTPTVAPHDIETIGGHHIRWLRALRHMFVAKGGLCTAPQYLLVLQFLLSITFLLSPDILTITRTQIDTVTSIHITIQIVTTNPL
jgi:hypothetical protein